MENEVTSKDAGKWTSCQERMPKPEEFEPWERVLVTVDTGDELDAVVAYLDTGGQEDRWREDGGPLLPKGAVTHWMRIPASSRKGESSAADGTTERASDAHDAERLHKAQERWEARFRKTFQGSALRHLGGEQGG